jgi:general L-amino acid transport system substrate-binding protein
MLRLLLGLFATGLMALTSVVHAQTLESIRAAHHMECGTVMGVDDWNGEDVHGNLLALEAEVCRAVAVAIFGDAGALTIQAFPAEPEALNALKAGTIQLAIGISPAASTAMQFGVGFGPSVFYDSQRLLVSKLSGIKELAGLRDKVVCALDMSPPERVLHDEMNALGIPYALQAHSEQGEMDAAVAVRRCEAGTGMESRLAQSRASFHALTSDFVFLPERLGLNPIVPAYRYGDQKFGLAIDWAVSALIEAEALGITQRNVAALGVCTENLKSDGTHAGRRSSMPDGCGSLASDDSHTDDRSAEAADQGCNRCAAVEHGLAWFRTLETEWGWTVYG